MNFFFICLGDIWSTHVGTRIILWRSWWVQCSLFMTLFWIMWCSIWPNYVYQPKTYCLISIHIGCSVHTGYNMDNHLGLIAIILCVHTVWYRRVPQIHFAHPKVNNVLQLRHLNEDWLHTHDHIRIICLLP